MKKTLELVQSALAAFREAKLTGIHAECVAADLAAVESNLNAMIEQEEAAPDGPVASKPKAVSRPRKPGLAIIAGLLALCAAFFAPAASAQIFNSQQSFNLTNGITFATAYVGAPTNTPGTNGICLGTGQYLYVPNNDKLAITFTGANTTTNIGNCVVQLVRSTSQTPPTYPWQFETAAILTLTFPMNGTNPVCVLTNLDSYAIGNISYIGVLSVSNTAAAGTITNQVNAAGYTNSPASLLTATGKIVPIRYP